MPSRAALVRRFGSWAKAVEVAGYQPNVAPRRSYRRLAHEEAVAIVTAFIEDERDQCRPPSSQYYPAWAPGARCNQAGGCQTRSRNVLHCVSSGQRLRLD